MRTGQGGFTLVGALVGVAVLGIVALIASDLMQKNSNFLSRSKQSRDRDRIVGSILNDVMEDLALLQRHFDSTDQMRDAVLDLKKLPYGWDVNIIKPASQCPKCPGRMGLIVQPLEGRAGLNRLTIRVTHSGLIQGYRDYVFIIADD